MKILNRNLIEKAADLRGIITGLDYPSDRENFKTGVEWAESQMEELAVDLLNFMMDNVELFDSWSRSKSTSEYCVKQFLKERDEES